MHKTSFESFYRQYWPKLVAALRWSTPGTDDAEDVAQEAFARAYARWETVRDHERPDAWLFLTAYRVAHSLRRRLSHRAEEQLVDAPAEAPGIRVEVIDALAHVSPRQRTALLLRYHYGFSTRESAKIMRCREGTIKSLIARGREAMKQQDNDAEWERAVSNE